MEARAQRLARAPHAVRRHAVGEHPEAARTRSAVWPELGVVPVRQQHAGRRIVNRDVGRLLAVRLLAPERVEERLSGKGALLRTRDVLERPIGIAVAERIDARSLQAILAPHGLHRVLRVLEPVAPGMVQPELRQPCGAATAGDGRLVDAGVFRLEARIELDAQVEILVADERHVHAYRAARPHVHRAAGVVRHAGLVVHLVEPCVLPHHQPVRVAPADLAVEPPREARAEPSLVPARIYGKRRSVQWQTDCELC